MDFGAIPKHNVDVHGPFVLGEWTVEPDRLRIRRDDKLRVLEPKCAELLLLFAKNSGRILSRDQILEGLWSGQFVENSVVKHLVWQLRKDLDDAAVKPRYVETIRRRGYRLRLAPQPLSTDDAGSGDAGMAGMATAGSWLHQLPPPPADFTGRDTELAELCEAVRNGALSLVGLMGDAGIGKSALALKLADELTPDYPDAQIYVDLQGSGPRPLTSAQAMANVIRSYRPVLSLPGDETALASLYRTVLYDQRILLLMDDAAGREQLKPLLLPRTCALVTTSRSSFTLPGMAIRHLEVLTTGDSVTLLRRIAPRLGEEADPLARLCEGLPSTLRSVGSALAERRDLDPAECAKRLREGQVCLGF